MLFTRRSLLPPLSRCCLLGALLLLAGISAFGQTGKKGPSPAPAAKPSSSPAAGYKLPDVVATFNGAPVRREELQRATEALLANQGRTLQSVGAADLDRVYRSVLDNVLASRLLAAAASAAGETVPDASVDQQFAAVRAQYPDQAAFDADLQKSGQTAEGLRGTLRLQLAQQQWLERQIADEIKLAPQEVEQFYKSAPPEQFDLPESVHASQLLVAVRKDAPPEDALDAEKKADSLAARARKGEAFDALATQASDDPRAKTTGGDLGFILRDKIMPEFADVAFKLKPGEIGGPVRTRLGYHVIKAQEHEAAHHAKLDEVRDQITAYLQGAKRQVAVARLLQGLRAKADIKILLPEQNP